MCSRKKQFKSLDMALIFNNNNDNDGEDDNRMFYVQSLMKYKQWQTKLIQSILAE